MGVVFVTEQAMLDSNGTGMQDSGTDLAMRNADGGRFKHRGPFSPI